MLIHHYLFRRLKYALLLLPALFLINVLFAQKTVQGKVTDSKDGSPVIGASVQPKGSRTGTSTAADGSFSVSVPAGTNTLLISSAEFERQEIDITGKSSVDVVLKAAAANLSEIVVTGYGTQRRKEVTAAITTIKAEQFNKGNK